MQKQKAASLAIASGWTNSVTLYLPIAWQLFQRMDLPDLCSNSFTLCFGSFIYFIGDPRTSGPCVDETPSRFPEMIERPEIVEVAALDIAFLKAAAVPHRINRFLFRALAA